MGIRDEINRFLLEERYELSCMQNPRLAWNLKVHYYEDFCLQGYDVI
jgi:hypothetical protein